MTEAAVMTARALVLADLRSAGLADATAVSIVEDALASRRWWAEQWPDGAGYVPGLVAQDVQEALEGIGVRWPRCPRHSRTEEDHQLYVEPELGEDPHWVCETAGEAVCRLGGLGDAGGTGDPGGTGGGDLGG